MALTVAIQMDPIERIDIAGDSTFALALEGQARGHTLLYYGPRDLTLREMKVMTRVRALQVRNERGNHFTLGESYSFDLSEADVVLMRQDPPFDMAYITATHLLERIHHQPRAPLPQLRRHHRTAQVVAGAHHDHAVGLLPHRLDLRRSTGKTAGTF